MKLTTLATIVCTAALVASTAPASAQMLLKRAPNFPQPTHDTSRNLEVCFYTATNFKQSRFCTHDEGSVFKVHKPWMDRIQSITVENATVEVCNETLLRGECQTFSADHKKLPVELLKNVNSFKVL